MWRYMQNYCIWSGPKFGKRQIQRNGFERERDLPIVHVVQEEGKEKRGKCVQKNSNPDDERTWQVKANADDTNIIS